MRWQECRRVWSELMEQFIKVLREWLELFIDDCLDQECPHCNRPLNLPTEEDINKWLKEGK